MFRSLLSFPFFIKERNVLLGFISHTNIANLAKKELKKNVPFFLKNVPFFFQYLYVYIYLYIFLYISKKKKGTFSHSFWKRTKRSRILFHSFKKNGTFFAFFSVLLKRMERSLRSFPFFRKERKRTECSFGSHKSPKTREKNEKERNILFLERKRT